MTDHDYQAWLAAFDAALRATLQRPDDGPVFDRTQCGQHTHSALNGRDRQTTANYWAGHKFGTPAKWR